MAAIIYISAILPSLAWLIFYLRKDEEPEPKRMILKVFLLGALFALPALFFQDFFNQILFPLWGEPLFLWQIISLTIFSTFFVVAFSEELMKYMAMVAGALRTSDMDEPVDLIIYMITAAMGFAAFENMLLFSYHPELYPSNLLVITVARFLSATFLHALASGIVGYFLVVAFCSSKKILIPIGILTATFLHGFYNLIVPMINEIFFFLILVSFLLILALLLSFSIRKAKELESICKMKG